MKQVRIVAVCLGLVVGLAISPASAQVTGAGYVFGAPGQVRVEGESGTTFHFGGGGEMRTARGLGVGSEIGYLGPTAGFGDGVGALNVNGSYYVPRKSSPLVPFVTGGYSLLFRNGHSNGWNVGGGVEYWLRPRVGLRVELRDQIHTDSGSTAHFWGFRVGLSFR